MWVAAVVLRCWRELFDEESCSFNVALYDFATVTYQVAILVNTQSTLILGLYQRNVGRHCPEYFLDSTNAMSVATVQNIRLDSTNAMSVTTVQNI